MEGVEVCGSEFTGTSDGEGCDRAGLEIEVGQCPLGGVAVVKSGWGGEFEDTAGGGGFAGVGVGAGKRQRASTNLVEIEHIGSAIRIGEVAA